MTKVVEAMTKVVGTMIHSPEVETLVVMLGVETQEA